MGVKRVPLAQGPESRPGPGNAIKSRSDPIPAPLDRRHHPCLPRARRDAPLPRERPRRGRRRAARGRGDRRREPGAGTLGLAARACRGRAGHARRTRAEPGFRRLGERGHAPAPRPRRRAAQQRHRSGRRVAGPARRLRRPRRAHRHRHALLQQRLDLRLSGLDPPQRIARGHRDGRSSTASSPRSTLPKRWRFRRPWASACSSRAGASPRWARSTRPPSARDTARRSISACVPRARATATCFARTPSSTIVAKSRSDRRARNAARRPSASSMRATPSSPGSCATSSRGSRRRPCATGSRPAWPRARRRGPSRFPRTSPAPARDRWWRSSPPARPTGRQRKGRCARSPSNRCCRTSRVLSSPGRRGRQARRTRSGRDWPRRPRADSPPRSCRPATHRISGPACASLRTGSRAGTLPSSRLARNCPTPGMRGCERLPTRRRASAPPPRCATPPRPSPSSTGRRSPPRRWPTSSSTASPSASGTGPTTKCRGCLRPAPIFAATHSMPCLRPRRRSPSRPFPRSWTTCRHA